MQLTYEDRKWVGGESDDLAPEDTRNIPFFGFAMATLLSMALWSYVAWTVWAIVR